MDTNKYIGLGLKYGGNIDGYTTIDGYVLTYVAAENKWEPKPSAGVSGSFTAGGDLTGTGSSQQVVSLTGTSNIVNVPNPTALAFGSAPAVAGVIRLTNNTGIFGKRPGGTDTLLINVDSSDTVNIGATNQTGQLNLNSAAGIVAQGSTFHMSVTNFIIRDPGIGGVSCTWVGNSAGINTINFSSGVTEIDYQSNGSTIYSFTSSKFITKKGLNRAVVVKATSYALAITDDVVIFSASGQTATLPSSPAIGDKYTVGLNAPGVSNTFLINGNGANIVYAGASTTPVTFTTGATSADQVITVMFDGTVWVAAAGY